MRDQQQDAWPLFGEFFHRKMSIGQKTETFVFLIALLFAVQKLYFVFAFTENRYRDFKRMPDVHRPRYVVPLDLI
jgi:hypothetical protein